MEAEEKSQREKQAEKETERILKETKKQRNKEPRYFVIKREKKKKSKACLLLLNSLSIDKEKLTLQVFDPEFTLRFRSSAENVILLFGQDGKAMVPLVPVLGQGLHFHNLFAFQEISFRILNSRK